MNDDFRKRLIAIRDDKVSHQEELLSLKLQGLLLEWEGEVNIDVMIAREQAAIDNLDNAIARLG